MGTAVFAAPGDGENGIQVHTKEVDRLYALGRQLVEQVKATRAIGDWVQDQKDAAQFLGSLRMLRGITDILADQPGYAATDQGTGAAVRARMKPIQSKVHEITDFIAQNVGLGNPLPVTAKKKVGAKNGIADTMLGILLDEQAAKDAVTVQEDKTIPESWKVGFFEALGIVIRAAMEEVLQTSRDEKLFATIVAAIDAHEQKTLAGAVLWLGQVTSVSGGNLPGVSSLWVAWKRVHSLVKLKKTVSKASKMSEKDAATEVDALVEDISFVLKLEETEKTTFRTKLKDLAEQRKAAKPGTGPDQQIKAAETRAATLHGELKEIVRKRGRLSSEFGVSAAFTLFNIAVLIGSIHDMWGEDLEWKDVMDGGTSVVSTAMGVCATLARQERFVIDALKVVETSAVGMAVGALTGVVSVIDGVVDLQMGFKNDNWWLVAAGSMQVGSGFLICLGVLCSLPGTQLIGVALGLAAGATLVLKTMFDDPMDGFVNELIKQIKECRSTYDQSLMMDNVEVSARVAELEALVNKTKIAVLDIDWGWKIDGKSPAQANVFARLKAIGLSTDDQLRKLTRTFMSNSSTVMTASSS